MVFNMRLMSISLIEPILPTEPRRYRVAIVLTDTGENYEGVFTVLADGTGVDGTELLEHLRGGSARDFRRLIGAIVSFDQAQPREAESKSVN
jgi:hypothetical protein